MATAVCICIRTHKRFRQVTNNINRYMKETDGKTQEETNYGDRWRDLGCLMDRLIWTDTQINRTYRFM